MGTSTLERVRALGPAIRQRSDEIERAGRLPLDVVHDLTQAGCFRMAVPEAYAGDELSLDDYFDVIEELSFTDGSIGWTTMIGSGAAVLFARLPRRSFEYIYAHGPDVIGAGALAPKGRAVRVDGGYCISGQWPFASGCQHSAWTLAQSMVFVDGQPEHLANGAPAMRVAVFPTAAAEILDTWHVAGLQGTGSQDLRLRDQFCPDDFTFQLFGGKHAPAVDTLLFRLPLLPLLSLMVASVAIGIGRAALDDVASLAAGGKRPAFAPQARLAASPIFQDRLGEADALLRAARALLRTEGDAAWARARNGVEFTTLDRARLRATGAQVASMVTRVVDVAYAAGGGSAVYMSSPLQRRLRDIHTLTQHAAIGRDFFAIVGAILAGEPVDDLRI